MDWLKELLKNAGVEESKIDGFVTEFNKEVPKHLIPKEKYNDVSEAKKKVESDLADRDKQLTDLKKDVGDNAELKSKIEQLQADNKTAKEQYDKEAKELRMSTALKLALAGTVHDPDIVIGLLDNTKIELDEQGSIKGGLEDQIKTLQESKGFLFVQEEKQTAFKGFKPFEGKEKGSDGAGSLGASFAKQANESSKAPENNHWG